jgi:hypothetical protein
MSECNSMITPPILYMHVAFHSLDRTSNTTAEQARPRTQISTSLDDGLALGCNLRLARR